MIKPSKEEMIALFESIEKSSHLKKLTSNIASLIGTKTIDALLPKANGEPDWDVEGLEAFCSDYGLKRSDEIGEALKIIRKQ